MIELVLTILIYASTATSEKSMELCWDSKFFGEKEWALTQEMCANSVRNFGHWRNSKHAITKLKNGECLKVVIFGGSVSYGDGLHTGEDPYGAHFVRYLNDRFPCHSGEGRNRHEYVLIADGGHSTVHFVHKLMAKDYPQLKGTDLVVVDTALNDQGSCGECKLSISMAEFYMQHPKRVGSWSKDAEAKWTEILVVQLQRILELKVSLIYLTTSWRKSETASEDDDVYGQKQDEQTPVMRYYGIPQISFPDALNPWNTPGMERWATNTLKSDHVHPRLMGHLMLAQLLIHYLHRAFETGSYSDYFATLQSYPSRYPPLFTIEEEDVNHFVPSSNTEVLLEINLDDLHADLSPIRTIQSWELKEDVKGKPGLISTKNGALLEIDFGVPAHSHTMQFTLSLEALFTYENIGSYRAKATKKGAGVVVVDETVDCLWEQHVSEPQFKEFKFTESYTVTTTEYTLSISVIAGTKVKLTDMIITQNKS